MSRKAKPVKNLRMPKFERLLCPKCLSEDLRPYGIHKSKPPRRIFYCNTCKKATSLPLSRVAVSPNYKAYDNVINRN